MRCLVIAALFLTLLSSCARREDPIVAQMKIRKMQSRTFVGHDARSVSKEIIHVLQDEGYMVKSVSTDIGLITAELSTNIEKFRSKFWAVLFSGRNARWKKHSVIDMTVNITELENQSRIRVNYLIRIFDNLGRIVDVHQILDEDIYTEFFNRIQRGLLRKEIVQ